MTSDKTPVEIYTSPFCGYCMMAKRLLELKDVVFREVSVMGNAEARSEMVRRAGGRRTVPQIFIDGLHIGGSDELHALDREGKLDPMLTA